MRRDALVPAAADPFRRLVLRAAERYRAAGRGAYWFTRGKLGGDPVFAALLRDGLVPDDARLVDLGCGQGVLMALLTEAQAGIDGWPAGWAPLPKRLSLSGFDLRADAVAAGAIALAGAARIVQADLREAPIPACDVVAILDVLHYVDAAAQEAVIGRCAAALADHGRLLLRVADASDTLAFRLTLFCDRVVTAVRGHWGARFTTRSRAGWIELLERHGFSVHAQPMSDGTPFANHLLVATRLPR